MNAHVSKEIQDMWPQFVFIGKPRHRHGAIIIRAKYKDAETNRLVGSQWFDLDKKEFIFH